MKFTRCGVECMGVCARQDETCPQWLAPDNTRLLPDEFEMLAGAVRLAGSEQILINSFGQIYSSAPQLRDAFGNLPDALVVNLWRAHWLGNLTVLDQAPDMAGLVAATAKGLELVAMVDRRS
ncbi:hypothetical protein [Micromonospora sp. NPDC005652]|uniref:hypothetical protein n=1 Tax=Micromonospora sp. NPDC005652 TaxID=3157046 RepID=UPI0033DE462E